MAFCDINIRRKDGEVTVLNKQGTSSSLYPLIVDYVKSNDVLTGREWFFNQLLQQSKIRSAEPAELALGLYSIAWHSDKTEGYWKDKINQLVPEIQEFVETEVKETEPIREINRDEIINQNKSETKLSELSSLMTNFENYFPQYSWLNDSERQDLIDLVDRGQIELTCKI